ncbi:hypothetical protein [Paenibacillus xylanilyticus]|uniref:Integrase catalytic domain-containing protein n=1 Tax=Paenibacillus xylanilyticus TaxID=248903 RepID=A0A7Y6BUZ6_9BACL|nr:hypothetical protein [Paenibacillus xylanilyticus]NUU75389.1 hypothetical protein [Paenibacillus xylanilyticus]
MSKRKLIENTELGHAIDLSQWSTVNIDKLSKHNQIVYEKRKKAVEMYFADHSHFEIEDKTGLHRNEVARLVKRCLALDAQKAPWGYRALIPNKRITVYKRENLPNAEFESSGMNGSFELLLETYPTIRDEIHRLYYRKKSRSVSDPVTRGKDIHRAMVKECRKVGLKAPNDYPFNTKEVARRSLYSYLKTLEDHDINKASGRYGQDISKLIKSTGSDEVYRQIIRPYEQVQFDGHKIDLHAVLVLKTPEGDDIYTVIDRIWLLVIFDVGTRTILGHYLSFNREYSSTDVLHCIRNSVVPWVPKILTIPGLQYPTDGGYPSTIIEETQWAIWDEILYDQAKANLATIVKDRLKQVVKCRVNPGKVGFPIKRAHIERWFGIFEENGFHRLPSTTGSNSKDPRRANPSKLAKKHRITVQHVEELVDVMIADYNGTEHEGVNFMTPLETMKSRLQNFSVNQLPEEQRNEVAFLSLQTTREIKGDVKHGRRPYIQYENVRYTSSLLSRSPGLIGKKVDIFVNVDDLRVIRAFLPDGSELGKLKAAGKWGITPHTLQVRREIFRLKRKKLIRYSSSENPIEVYQKFLGEGAKTSSRKAGKAYELSRNQERNKDVSLEQDDHIDQPSLPGEVCQTEVNSNNTISANPKKIVKPTEEDKHGDSRKFRRAIIY